MSFILWLWKRLEMRGYPVACFHPRLCAAGDIWHGITADPAGKCYGGAFEDRLIMWSAYDVGFNCNKHNETLSGI